MGIEASVTVSTNFHPRNLRRLQVRFDQNWPSGIRGQVILRFELQMPDKTV